MRPENLFRAMNEIDPKIIEGSEHYKEKSNLVKMKHYIPLAACACFAIVILAVVPNAINKKQMSGTEVMTETAMFDPDEIMENSAAEEFADESAEESIEKSMDVAGTQAMEEQQEEAASESMAGVVADEQNDAIAEEPIEGEPSAYSEEGAPDSSCVSVSVDDTALEIQWEDNESARSFVEYAGFGPVSIQMYGFDNVEQYALFGADMVMPLNNIDGTVLPGDIVLYEPSKLAIVYGEHAACFTKIGSVTNLSEEELKNLLSDHNVMLTINAE